MTILPKQKAAGTAPKKSVNRDGNHSRDIGHERQGVSGTNSAERGWVSSSHVGSAPNSAWPSGVGPPIPGPSSSPRGWGSTAVPGTSGSLVAHPGKQNLTLTNNLIDPLANVGATPEGHRSPVGLEDRHKRGHSHSKKRPAPNSLQAVSHSDGFPFVNHYSHKHSDRLEDSLREECGEDLSCYSGAPSGPKRGRLQSMTVIRKSREASAANAVGAAVAAQAASRGHNQDSEVSQQSLGTVSAACAGEENVEGGYNSEDEYSHIGVQLTEEEWQEKDRRFERLIKKKKGYVIKKMQEDGSCLFRAVADQIYGDEEMHSCVRGHCMDYIEQNSDYFSQYVTEEITEYVERKRFLGVHGNHLEIQALSEMYNRPIHIYCYSAEPINIFQAMGDVANNANAKNVPIRLCYHRGCHYNSLVDPHTATIGVGLGLPNHNPGAADRNLVGQAVRQSEQDVVEKTMLEDKIKATDWEATNEAIEEQVARESYLQWLRDNEKRNCGSLSFHEKRNIGSKPVCSRKLSSGTSTPSSASTATVTSGELRRALNLASAENVTTNGSGSPVRSPKPSCSSSGSKQIGQQTPTTGQKLMQIASLSPKAGCSSERDSPKPSGSSSQQQQVYTSKDSEFQLLETATFLNGLPPNIFGLEDWSEADVLTKVLAASQEEYLLTLKHKQSNDSSYNDKCNSEIHKQPQRTEVPLDFKKENTSSASTSPISHDKNDNIRLLDNQDQIVLTDSQILQDAANRCNAAPISILPSGSMQKNSEIVQNQGDLGERDPKYSTENHILSNDDCAVENSLLHIVPREYSENACVISQECSETVSRTNSPELKDSQENDETS